MTSTFTIKHGLTDLYFDFRGEKVVSLNVNGKAVDIEWNGLFIKISREHLIVGQNKVNIRFN